MVVCPRCGCPQEESALVGDWDVRCGLCDWRGGSAELVRLSDDGKFTDPRVLIRFFHFLHKQVAPDVGLELVRLGLVSSEKSPGNVHHLTKLLVAFSRAGFQAVLEGILKAKGEAPDASQLH